MPVETTSWLRIPTAVVYPLLLIFLAATEIVYAHAELVAASPAPGETVSNPVSEIRLSFSEPVTDASQIVIFADNFRVVDNIKARPDANAVSDLIAPLPELAAGVYTVQWTAVSADGHEISGSYIFGVDPSASSSIFDAVNWQWLLLLLGAVLTAAFVVQRRREHKAVFVENVRRKS